MKTYAIDAYEEQSGQILVKAKNKTIAKKKAQELLDYYGLGGLEPNQFNAQHREAHLL